MAVGPLETQSAHALEKLHLSLQQFEILYQKPDPFPKRVFPQLHGLKREIQKNRQRAFLAHSEQAQSMDHLDWSTGTRANRPFGTFEQTFARPQYQFDPSRLQTIPKLPTSPKPPTAYYLEQLSLATAPPSPIPQEDREPIAVDHGLLGDFAVLTFNNHLKPLFNLASSRITSLVVPLLSLVFLYGLVKPKKYLVRIVGGITWDMVLAFFVALIIVNFLPKMGRDVSDGVVDVGGRLDEPLYVIKTPWSASMRREWPTM